MTLPTFPRTPAGIFPSGPYIMTYGGSYLQNANSTEKDHIAPVGLTEGPIRHQQNLAALPVRCSEYGQTIIDYIVQGGGCFCVVTIKEWFAGARKLMWPFESGTANNYEKMGAFPMTGALLSRYARKLTLTALPYAPANLADYGTAEGADALGALSGPVTRTYARAILLPGHNLDITFGPVERNVQVVLTILPQVFNVVSNVNNDAASYRRGQPHFYEDTYVVSTGNAAVGTTVEGYPEMSWEPIAD